MINNDQSTLLLYCCEDVKSHPSGVKATYATNITVFCVSHPYVSDDQFVYFSLCFIRVHIIVLMLALTFLSFESSKYV